MPVVKLILLSIGLLALAFSGLAIKLLLNRNAKFPEHRVGHNKEMRKRKIYCVNTQDRMEQKRYLKERKAKLEEERQAALEKSLIYQENTKKPDLSQIRVAVD